MTDYIKPTTLTTPDKKELVHNVRSGVTSNNEIIVTPADDLQIAINTLANMGGGTMYMTPGEYTIEATITLRSNVDIVGLGYSDGLLSASTDNENGVLIISGMIVSNYCFILQGTNVYTEGTISVDDGSSTVTGTGTSWTQSMVGQSILVGGFWRVITAVNSATSLIAPPAFGVRRDTLTNVDYAIAYPASCSISNVVFWEALSGAAGMIHYQYTDRISLQNVTFYDTAIAVKIQDSARPQLNDMAMIFASDGIVIDNVGGLSADSIFANGQDVFQTNGGFTAIDMTQASMSNFTFEGFYGYGMSFTTSSRIHLSNFFLLTNQGEGMIVNSSFDFTIHNGLIQHNVNDGILLNATTDRFIISNNHFVSNNDNGLDIAAASCDNNLVIGNIFNGNGSTAMLNSGTGTLIRSNIGVADN